MVFPDNWTIKNFLDIGRIDIFGINQLLDQKYSLLQGHTRAVLPFFNTMVITPAIVKKLIQVWENYVFNVLICSCADVLIKDKLSLVSRLKTFLTLSSRSACRWRRICKALFSTCHSDPRVARLRNLKDFSLMHIILS